MVGNAKLRTGANRGMKKMHKGFRRMLEGELGYVCSHADEQEGQRQRSDGVKL